MKKYQVLLFSPALYKGNKGVYDSELIYLGQFLYNLGYQIQIIDAFADSDNKLKKKLFRDINYVLIIHLWKNELLYNKKLERILIDLLRLKKTSNIISVIGVGSLAGCISNEIFKYNDAIDIIVNQNIVLQKNKHFDSSLLLDIQNYYKEAIYLTKEFLMDVVKINNQNVVSIFSSRGCVNSCSFCSYNKNVIGYSKRDIRQVVKDIILLSTVFKVRNIAFSDSNFGANTKETLKRSRSLLDEIKKQEVATELSLNISFNSINKSILDNFCEAGVTTLMIGLETLNLNTLNSLYNKQLDLTKAKKMIDYAEEIGMRVVVSYILFRPLLTFMELREELISIEQFGRYRIAQFMANSILRVIPNTKMEKMLKKGNYLIKNDFFDRKFIFVDERVKNIYNDLLVFYKSRIKYYNNSTKSLAKLKILEWEYLTNLVNKKYL